MKKLEQDFYQPRNIPLDGIDCTRSLDATISDLQRELRASKQSSFYRCALPGKEKPFNAFLLKLLEAEIRVLLDCEIDNREQLMEKLVAIEKQLQIRSEHRFYLVSKTTGSNKGIVVKKESYDPEAFRNVCARNYYNELHFPYFEPVAGCPYTVEGLPLHAFFWHDLTKIQSSIKLDSDGYGSVRSYFLQTLLNPEVGLIFAVVANSPAAINSIFNVLLDSNTSALEEIVRSVGLLHFAVSKSSIKALEAILALCPKINLNQRIQFFEAERWQSISYLYSNERNKDAKFDGSGILKRAALTPLGLAVYLSNHGEQADITRERYQALLKLGVKYHDTVEIKWKEKRGYAGVNEVDRSQKLKLIDYDQQGILKTCVSQVRKKPTSGAAGNEQKQIRRLQQRVSQLEKELELTQKELELTKKELHLSKSSYQDTTTKPKKVIDARSSVPCKFFKAGKPESCRHGDECHFQHLQM